MSIFSIALIIVTAGLLTALFCMRLGPREVYSVQSVIGAQFLLSAELAALAFILFPSTPIAQSMGDILAGGTLLAASYAGGMVVAGR